MFKSKIIQSTYKKAISGINANPELSAELEKHLLTYLEDSYDEAKDIVSGFKKYLTDTYDVKPEWETFVSDMRKSLEILDKLEYESLAEKITAQICTDTVLHHFATVQPCMESSNKYFYLYPENENTLGVVSDQVSNTATFNQMNSVVSNITEYKKTHGETTSLSEFIEWNIASDCSRYIINQIKQLADEHTTIHVPSDGNKWIQDTVIKLIDNVISKSPNADCMLVSPAVCSLMSELPNGRFMLHGMQMNIVGHMPIGKYYDNTNNRVIYVYRDIYATDDYILLNSGRFNKAVVHPGTEYMDGDEVIKTELIESGDSMKLTYPIGISSAKGKFHLIKLSGITDLIMGVINP